MTWLTAVLVYLPVGVFVLVLLPPSFVAGVRLDYAFGSRAHRSRYSGSFERVLSGDHTWTKRPWLSS